MATKSFTSDDLKFNKKSVSKLIDALYTPQKRKIISKKEITELKNINDIKKFFEDK